MFPKELRFSIHPRELQSAVELLPEPKGKSRRSSSASTELKNKLLQVPVEKLRLWKMKPKMLSMLPYLVVEKDNKDLQKRILAISIASMENCSEDTLLALLGYLYRKKEFIQAMNARFVKTPPSENSWLKKYYKAFRSQKPASNLAEVLLKETDDITMLDTFLSIPKTSPFFEMVCMHYAKNYDWNKLRKCSFEDVLGFLNRGIPLKIKQKLLLELLKEYCSAEYPIVVLQSGSPLRALCLKAMSLFGTFDNPIWKSIPEARRLTKLLSLEKKLQTYLGFGDSFSRLRWWKLWIESIEEIVVHRPSSLICLYLKDFVIVESLAVAQWLYIYDRRDFMLYVQPQLWNSSPFQISLEGDVIDREIGWQNEMNCWMIRQGFQKGEEW